MNKQQIKNSFFPMHAWFHKKLRTQENTPETQKLNSDKMIFQTKEALYTTVKLIYRFVFN